MTLSTNATHSSSSNYNAGTWTITPSAAIGSGLSNYTITYASASTGLTVAPKALSIAGLSGTNRVYDSTTADLITGSPSLIGKVPGDTVILGTGTGTAAFANPNVGTGKTVTFSGYSISGADAANYSLSQPASSTANITAAGLTITASNQSETYGFGGTSAALGTTAFTASGLFGSDSVTSVTLSTNATLSSSSNYNAGTWNITPSAAIGSGLSNYTITYDENSTGLTVAAKALTLTALDQSRSYGDVNPALTYTITGLVPGDFLDSSELTGSPDIQTTAEDYTSGGRCLPHHHPRFGQPEVHRPKLQLHVPKRAVRGRHADNPAGASDDNRCQRDASVRPDKSRPDPPIQWLRQRRDRGYQRPDRLAESLHHRHDSQRCWDLLDRRRQRLAGVNGLHLEL